MATIAEIIESKEAREEKVRISVEIKLSLKETVDKIRSEKEFTMTQVVEAGLEKFVVESGGEV